MFKSPAAEGASVRCDSTKFECSLYDATNVEGSSVNMKFNDVLSRERPWPRHENYQSILARMRREPQPPPA